MNEQGRHTLIAVLQDLRDGRRNDFIYRQDIYFDFDAFCKVGCLAHIAYVLEYGHEYCRIAYSTRSHRDLVDAMLESGRKLLGLPIDYKRGIFGSGIRWPAELGQKLRSSNWKDYDAAIEALQRLQDDGSFGPKETETEVETEEVLVESF